ncbi:hypothetical protein [Halanaerobium sp. ST460_2HS_T2]|uniref:hypothetical protein n=1 Tax=Halanaerobium sp. ST460_2HS_T2 TaxID=2183914 RepID=UPI000DF49B00|nr:hypothetical protein [Halanaerobium sp. ST460_2HS_T2]RCW60942.1 hypothetical protein DFR80_106101 [Halanaerobium sp. ST460_2HS_T2]
MHYYRKAIAIFILVLALMLPLFLEKQEQTAVVNLEAVISASSFLSQIRDQIAADPEKNQISLKQAENKIMDILRVEAEELALEKSYSSVLIDQAIYKGGKDISQELADKIDNKYK